MLCGARLPRPFCALVGKMGEGKTEGKIEGRIDGNLDEERVVEGPGASSGLKKTKGRTAKTFPMPLATMSTHNGFLNMRVSQLSHDKTGVLS